MTQFSKLQFLLLCIAFLFSECNSQLPEHYPTSNGDSPQITQLLQTLRDIEQKIQTFIYYNGRLQQVGKLRETSLISANFSRSLTQLETILERAQQIVD